MNDQADITDTLGALVTRVASIELRFSSRGRAINSVGLYSDIIAGVEAPDSMVPPVSMRLGNVQELRFVEAAANSDCTVVYWAVAVDSEPGLLAACEVLKSTGCHMLEPPYYRPDQPKTACCLLQNPGGNVFGLIINPPVP